MFNSSDKRKILSACIIQLLLSLLDLLGVALFGLLGSLSVSGVQSKSPTEGVSTILKILGIQQLMFQNQVAILGIAATFVFMIRTLLSVIFSRRILFFISRASSKISIELASKLFSKGLTELYKRSTQQNLYALTTGVQNITLGVIGTGTILFADISLILVLLIGLFTISKVVAISTLVIFAITGLIFYSTMEIRAAKLSKEKMRIEIQGAETLIELSDNFREYFVRNRIKHPIDKFALNRSALAESSAELTFIPTLSKYVIEACMLLAALLISAVQFSIQDASQAISTLVILIAASSRIAPAAIRLQHGLITIRGNLASSDLTLDLINESKNWVPLPAVKRQVHKSHEGFKPDIEIKDMSFSYSDRQENVLNQIELSLQEGKFLALVGKSGAGKSTLVDALLGLVTPQHGTIKISGKDPKSVLENWPGAVAYVPQQTHILNASIRSNICLGFNDGEFDDDEIADSIRLAQLDQFVSSLELGLDTMLGEYGIGLSGGQRQRLGIARALLTKPRLIVLDEATSSLDAQTEAEIGRALYQLRGSVTVVVIAHRLSTAMNADLVAYLEVGKIQALGKFDDVRRKVPDFDAQAKLMGL